MCSGSEAGSYLRLIDSCITQFKAQGPSRTCTESKEEKLQDAHGVARGRITSKLRDSPASPTPAHHPPTTYTRPPSAAAWIMVKG